MNERVRAAAATLADAFFTGMPPPSREHRAATEANFVRDVLRVHDPDRECNRCAGCQAAINWRIAELVAQQPGRDDDAQWYQRMGDAFYLAHRSVHVAGDQAVELAVEDRSIEQEAER
jgi:hypothetical protein